MTTIHIIDNAGERELVKRVFRQRVRDIAEGIDPSGNVISGDLNYQDDGSCSCLFNYGALVYDIKGDGDPELGWLVYDFRNTKCYTIDEADLAGLVNELPSSVFPF